MDAITRAANITLVAINSTANGSTVTPTFIKVVSPWMPTIDTLATIAGDGLGLIVKVVQLGVAIRQLHSLFRLEHGKLSTS